MRPEAVGLPTAGSAEEDPSEPEGDRPSAGHRHRTFEGPRGAGDRPAQEEEADQGEQEA